MVPHALHSRQAEVTFAKQGTSLGLRCSTLPPKTWQWECAKDLSR